MGIYKFVDIVNLIFPVRTLFITLTDLKSLGRYFICGLIISYVGSAFPYLEPEFVPTTSNITYSKGDLAILFCAVKNLGTKIVSWRKTSDPNPLTVGTLIYVPDTRFHVSYIEYRGEWNLYIKNVSHEDAGIYECQVSTHMRDMRQYVRLNVKDPPVTTTVKITKKKDIIISGPVTVDVGNELYVSCNVSTAAEYNQTILDIDWFIDGVIVDTKDPRMNVRKEILDFNVFSLLTIKHATKQDTAEYICRTSTKQIGRRKIFVLSSEKTSSNIKRRTDQTDSIKISSRTNNGHTVVLLTFYSHFYFILSIVLYYLVR